MNSAFRKAIEEFDLASANLNAKNRDIARVIRRIGSAPVTDGKLITRTVALTENDAEATDDPT